MTLGTSRFVAAAACVAACGVVLVAGPLTPPAGPVQSTQLALDDVEPRTPLTSEFVSSGFNSVFEITEPGHYYLTENLEVPSGSNGIGISANDVTIDLNGFTVRGLPGSLDTIRNFASRNNQVVRNGFVLSQQNAIVFAGGSTRTLVENVHIDSEVGGIFGGTDMTIRDCAIVTGVNAVFGAGRLTVEGSTIESGGFAIEALTQATIRNNRIASGQTGPGNAVLVREGSSIVGNTIRVGNGSTTGVGIRADESTVKDNTLTGLGTGIRNNGGVTSGNTVDGFDVGIFGAGTIVNNSVTDSNGAGIEAGDARIEGNTVRVADGLAIRAGDSTTITGNTLIGLNMGSGILVAGERVVVEHNTFKDLGVGLSIGANRGAVVRSNTFISVSSAPGFIDPTGNLTGPSDTTLTSTSPYANIVLP